MNRWICSKKSGTASHQPVKLQTIAFSYTNFCLVILSRQVLDQRVAVMREIISEIVLAFGWWVVRTCPNERYTMTSYLSVLGHCIHWLGLVRIERPWSAMTIDTTNHSDFRRNAQTSGLGRTSFERLRIPTVYGSESEFAGVALSKVAWLFHSSVSNRVS